MESTPTGVGAGPEETPKEMRSSDANTATEWGSGWWASIRRWGSRNRDDLLRDALVAIACGAVLLAAAIWFDDRRQDRAELLENIRFVRQTAMEPNITVKPFRGLNLRGASLEGLPLGCPDKKPAGCTDFSFANLSGANLSYADLNLANLTHANLYGANLTQTRLDHARLSKARLGGAKLYKADLTEAQMPGVRLGGADLNRATLTGAYLPNAILTGANLKRADLTGGANLAGAVLAGANLNRADLTEAILTNADLTNADLTEATLTGICYNANTQWPEGFEPPAKPSC